MSKTPSKSLSAELDRFISPFRIDGTSRFHLRSQKPNEKGGKVSAAQTNLKQLILGALEKVNDESDKENRVRLVLEPRSSRQDPEEFMQLLLTHTSLEENFPVNLVVLGIDGRPKRKNIRDILDEWISFRIITVTRRSNFRPKRMRYSNFMRDETQPLSRQARPPQTSRWFLISPARLTLVPP